MNKLIRLFLAALLIAFLAAPTMVLQAAQNGAEIWFANVLPALLPFFIINQMISAYDVLNLFSRWCHRATTLLWRLPGESAFILLVGYTSGAPVSSTLVADAYQRGALTRPQAIRLLAASANVSPLFIFSVAAAGFLSRPDLGLPLLAAVYGSNLILSLAVARLTSRNVSQSTTMAVRPPTPPSFGRALTTATSNSLRSIALIGGLMVIYFAWLAICEKLMLPDILVAITERFGINGSLVRAAFYGLFEVTAGSRCAATLPFDSLRPQLAALATVLAFGGLSVHSQVSLEIEKTNLSLSAFTKYKAMQALLAYGLMYCIPFKSSSATVSGISPMPLATTGDFYLSIIFVLLMLPYAALLILCLREQTQKISLIRRRYWNQKRTRG